MRLVYTFCFYLALPVILLRALWRSKDPLNKGLERISLYNWKPLDNTLWIHAVSYGEAIAAEPLIQQLRIKYPNNLICVTTMTSTGANRVQTRWKEDDNIRHIYLPYDIPLVIKRFFHHIKPKIGIIMETELWPNLLYLAGKNNIPLMLANARLSIRSFQGYKRLRFFIKPLLKNINLIASQSEQDALHFRQLGAIESNVKMFGNLKFDINPPLQQITDGQKLKQQLPFDLILIAASTHQGEEDLLIDAFAQIKRQYPYSLLILVPRHPQRFNEIALKCQKQGYQVARRSLNQLPDKEHDIYLGDSMGELYFYYALADIAFVGGSLVPVGGHNLLEPAALKLPIVTGPHLFNFNIISNRLLAAKALYIAKCPDSLLSLLNALCADKDKRQQTGLRGFAVLDQYKGATLRHINEIEKILSISR